MKLVSPIRRAGRPGLRSVRAPLSAAVLASTLLGLHTAPASAVERAQPSAAAAAAPLEYSDRLIVRYRSAAEADVPSAGLQLRAHAAAQPFGTHMKHLRRLGTGAHVFQLDRPMPQDKLQQMARALQNGDADVEYAEPDLRMRPQFVPNDAKYAKQWNLFEPTTGLNLPTAWEKSTGAGVVVAVVDTGVRPHVDLQANLLPGYDFVTDRSTANDGNARDADASDPGDWTVADECGEGWPGESSSWHGTHVAGIAAAVANNGIGVAGVAHGAKLLPVRAMGRCGGYTSDIADGMIWAAGGKVSRVPANKTPARVINLSLGGASRTCSTTYSEAIKAVRQRGAVVVVAAGNENMSVARSTPANCADVVVVTAVKRNGHRASYANYGTAVDLAAPGGDTGAGILSTLNSGTRKPAKDTYAGYSGTSMATPHVAGVAALMLSVNPKLTPTQVETLLKASVRPFPGNCTGCGKGMLDANMAVDAAITARSLTVQGAPGP
ncbi:S8 family peptidase [Azohydromonas australica]|uniref:S8 family peptidase n=1 Tax=Azohydromonas australica TaxID=364039 RepID=UPI000420D677|nr:S8 family peptidase [Azohydromonas australica]